MPLTGTRRSFRRSVSRAPRSPLILDFPRSANISKLYTAWRSLSIGGQAGEAGRGRRPGLGNRLPEIGHELARIHAEPERLGLVVRHMAEAGDDADQRRLVGAVQQKDPAAAVAHPEDAVELEPAVIG